MQFNWFTLSLLASSAIAIVLAIYVGQRFRRVHAGLELALMLVSIAVWSAAAMVEAMVLTPQAKELVSGISYFGIQFAPVFFLLLTLRVSGRTGVLIPRNIRALLLFPALVLLLALTNPLHGWIWREVRLETTLTLGQVGVFLRGPAFWFAAFFAYVMMGLGLLVLIESLRHRPKLFQRQALLLLLAALGPLALNATYLLHDEVSRTTDLTPVVFTISGLMMALALLRYRLLDIMPIPSDTLVRRLSDGLVAIDRQARIVGINPAACAMLNLSEASVGETVEAAFADLPSLRAYCRNPALHPQLQLTAFMKGESRYLAVEWITINDSACPHASALLRLQDVTERVRQQQSLERAESLQRVLLQVATDLINMPPERIDAAIREGLAVVGRAVGVGRARLMRYDFAHRRVIPGQSWQAAEVLTPSVPAAVDADAPLDAYADWLTEHRRARPVVIASVDMLSPDDPVKPLLVGQGSRAVVAYPLTHETDCYGYVEFSIFEREKRWMQDDLKLFELFAQLVANAEFRRHTEGRLQQLSQAVEQSPASVVITDDTGNIEYVNPRFVAVTGYRADEVLGQNPRLLKSGNHPPEVYQDLWHTLTAGEEWRGELQNRKKNGALFWESAAISPLRNRDGRTTHYVAVKEDITLKKAALENLEIVGERLSTVIRHFSGGLLLEDVSRSVILSNQAFCSLLNLPDSPEALVGANGDKRIIEAGVLDLPVNGAADFHARTAAIVAAGKPVSHEELSCADGRVFERDYIPVLRGEVPMGHLWIYVDATQRKLAERDRITVERQMQQNQKIESLGVMAGSIAHDFNNLIMAIMGNVELVMLDLEAGDPNRESLQDAIQASRRAAELTRQMLAYAGKGQYKTENVDMNVLVRDMPPLLKAAARENIEIEMAFADNLPSIEADAGQIRQVILNLVQNAAEAIGEQSGRITITTAVKTFDAQTLKARNRMLMRPKAGQYLCLEVADNGSGMSAETVERIFDPFYTTRFTGRGLGMSAVHGIVKAHEGAIFIESAPGAGSRITVLFPVRVRPDAIPACVGRQPAEGMETARQRSLLLVEDEPLVRGVAEKLLAKLGYTVTTANDGVEAIAICKSDGPIDCILLDLSMPRMDGPTALPELRGLRPGVPIVLCTGHDETDAAKRAGDGTVAAIIHKPYAFETLRETLDFVLAPANP